MEMLTNRRAMVPVPEVLMALLHRQGLLPKDEGNAFVLRYTQVAIVSKEDAAKVRRSTCSTCVHAQLRCRVLTVGCRSTALRANWQQRRARWPLHLVCRCWATRGPTASLTTRPS